MAKDRKWISTVCYSIFATLAAIVVIVLGVPKIIELFEPDLMAIANGGNWSAPFYVEEELIFMQKVSHACERLKAGMPDDDAVKKAFPKVHEFTSKAISQIEPLEPCEADNVKSLRAMYAIEIQNNGGRTSNRILLEITDADAKYVRYENYGKNETVTDDFRDDKCRIVSMGRLEPEGRILANAWVISPVSQDGGFKITQENRQKNVPLYMETPVGSIAGWVNKHLYVSLVLMLFFVFVSCYVTYWVAMKSFRKQKSYGATAERSEKNEE